MELKQCPETKQWFPPKRKNQKYLSKSVRINANNSIAKKVRESKSTIQKALDRDRKIIETLLNGEPGKILPTVELEKLQFDFKVFTDYSYDGEQPVIGIYEFRYINNGKHIKIFRK